VYDTVKVALEQLTDDKRFEQVAVAVLSERRFPHLRITGPSGDKGRDAFTRELFHEKDSVALMVSLEKAWTKKLKSELDKVEKRSPSERPTKAIFVTNRSTSRRYHDPYVERAKKLGTALEVFDLSEFVQSLEMDQLRPIAEAMLGVRPTSPRALVPAQVYLTQLAATVAGVDAPLVGRDTQLKQLADIFSDSAADAARIVLVDGQGGTGKTRVTVEAAASVCATLVVPTGVGLPPESLSLIPLNSPAVVIVDDAHRCPDLSGIAAMFNDGRYHNVKVALTCRQGTTGAAFHASGIEKYSKISLSLDLLSAAAMEQVVRGHGFDDPGFIKTVIDTSAGSPLIAHEICQHVTRHGHITWTDVSDILEHLVDERLLSSRQEDLDPKRAVAVAVAVLGSVRGPQDIAALQGAVSRLPQSLDAIDRYLWELADSGVAATAQDASGVKTFSMSPHLLAHVLISTAIRDDARVSLDIVRTLGVLGPAACQNSSGSVGFLGIGPLLPGTYVHTRPLAAQLEVLAQAASRHRASGVGGLLARAVYELLPERPTFEDWETVLALSGPVAPVAPVLLDDLRTKIDQSWPPPQSQPRFWWPGDEPQSVRAQEIRRFVEHVATLTTRSGHTNPAGAVRLLLTASARAHTEQLSTDLAPLSRAIEQIAHPSRHDASTTLDRRTRVVDAVVDWMNGQATSSANVDLASVDHGAWARVSVAALKPFLIPTFETSQLGYGAGAEVVLFGATLLPADSRLTSTTSTAADAIGTVIRTADLSTDSGAAGSFTQSLIDLPHELRGAGLRGLSGQSGPLPRYAIELLGAAGATITAALASRWTDLPLAARHHAAKRCVDRRGARGSYRSLAQRAASGDVLAKLAVADADLAPLLTLVPVDVNVNDYLEGNTKAWNRAETRRRTAAESLATPLSWRDGIEVLAGTAPLGDDGVAEPPRKAFAHELITGLNANEVEELLDVLIGFDNPLPHERELVEGLNPGQSSATMDALKRRATSIRGGEVLQHAFGDISDTERGEVSTLLLDLIRPPKTDARATTDEPATDSTRRSAAQRLATNLTTRVASAAGLSSRQLLRLGRRIPLVSKAAAALESPPVESPDHAATTAAVEQDAAPTDAPDAPADQVRLAQSFAHQVFWANWAGRADTLIKIGESCPLPALISVLRLIAMGHKNDGRWQPFTEAQWSAAVPLVRRWLEDTSARRPVLLDDYDTGRLIRVLAVQTPNNLASTLADLLTHPDNDHLRWASAWRTIFAEVPAADRTPFALALTRGVDAVATTLPEHARFDLDQTMAEICAGTVGWEAALLDLAAGSQADKERAVATIAKLWREPAWSPVVSTLLRSGLTSEQTGILVNGIDMNSFGHDDDERVERRRTALAAITPSDDPAITAFVARANARIDSSVTSFRRL
jgi:hypothetical protein